MRRNFLTVLIFILAVSCTVASRLKKMEGRPVSELFKEWGAPHIVIPQENDSLYVYRKQKQLKSTEISQGQMTLDPIITPAVIKSEEFIFIVKNGKVIKTKHELDYTRK